MSAQELDLNGYINIEDNPISKEGVFPYTGAQIGTREQIEQGIIDPNKMYNVYRPAEELLDPECIESFKLIPFTDEHELLGPTEEGLTPAEKKGVQGVTGENVYFDTNDGYLKSNLKIFSEKLSDLIQKGKKELSIGYRCAYDLTRGVYNGINYDAIQRKLRGNHLALVDMGRAGPDVAVLDHFKFTIDSKEIKTMNEETTAKPSLEEAVVNGLGAMQEAIRGIAEKLEALASAGAKAADEDVKVEDADTEEEKKTEDENEVAAEMGDAKEMKDAMDSAVKKVSALEKKVVAMEKTGLKALMSELTHRNALAQKISQHIGAFDHSEKTAEEVAKYGVEKLGLKCKAGQEITALDSFFHGVSAKDSGQAVFVGDSDKTQKINIDSILKGK